MGQPVGNSSNESPLHTLIPYLVFAWVLIFWSRFFLTILPGVGIGEIDRVDILFAVPEILWSNVFPDHRPDGPASWSNLIQRIPILGYALFILAGALAAGRLSLRALGLNAQFNRTTHLAFSGGLGLSILSLLTLGAGLLGSLSRPLFATLLGSLILIDLAASIRNRSQVQSSRKLGGSLRWLMCGCLLFLAPMLLGAMLPSTDFDVKEYHLEGPKEYFLAGEVHFLPHNVYTSFPFLTEMLTLCGMVLTNDWFVGALVGKTVLMAFAPLTALGIFSVGRKIAGDLGGGFAALVYLSTPWTYRISIIAYTEGAMCCYGILSLLSLLCWFDSIRQESLSRQRSLSFLCGVLAGSTISTKYPGMVLVAIPVALSLLLTVFLWKIPRRHSLSMAGLYILGGVFTFGPWMAKNLNETGNPVYPLMYSVFGGEDWDAELNAKWKAGHARPSPLIQSPGAMWQEFQKNVVDVTLGSVWQSPLMFGLAPLAFLYRKRSRDLWIVAGAAVTILSVWYTMTHLIDRFWVPVLPVIAVLSGVGFVALRDISQSSGNSNSVHLDWIRQGVSCLVLITLVFNFAFMTTPASGYNSYLIDDVKARQQVKPPSVVLAEQAVGANGCVLFVGEAMVFDCECNYRYNTVFDASLLEQWTSRKLGENHWELLSPDEIASNFRAGGITHILINWNEILRYRTTYGYTDFVSPQRIADLGQVWPFIEVNLPDNSNLRDWETLDDSWKSEVERWGPELKRTTPSGTTKMKQYQMLELARQ